MTISATFSNFWRGFRYQPNCQSHRFLFGRLEGERLRISSVFGRLERPADVCFSGESVPTLRHDGARFVWKGGSARWFFGVPKIEHRDALWLPHFYVRWADYRQKDEALSHVKREFGISAVIGNLTRGGLARRRAALVHALSGFVPVHATVALRRCAPPWSRVVYHAVPNKLAFVAAYTHNLCFENDSSQGYLTEKIFDSVYAGAVPIYAGDPLVSEWIEPGSFVDAQALEAEGIVNAINGSRDTMARVSSERERLCRVTFEEMEARLSEFQRRIVSGKSGGREPVSSGRASVTSAEPGPAARSETVRPGPAASARPPRVAFTAVRAPIRASAATDPAARRMR